MINPSWQPSAGDLHPLLLAHHLVVQLVDDSADLGHVDRGIGMFCCIVWHGNLGDRKFDFSEISNGETQSKNPNVLAII